MMNISSGKLNVDVAETVRRLESLLHCESVSGDYVRLRIGVFEAQAATLCALADSTAPATAASFQGKSPALEPEMVRFHPALSKRLFDSIADACRQHGNPGFELTRLRSVIGGRPSLLEELMRRSAFAPGEEHVARLAGRLEVPAPLLLFLGRLLAAPFVTHAARGLEPEQIALSASDGSCPACGSTPALARLHPGDGRRVLHCSLCGQSWTFGRLVCPFCGNRDQSTLSKLAIDGEETRWIEACERCRHYLNTIDGRQSPQQHEFFPLVEEVAALYLDLLSQKEGYARKPPYAAVG